MKKLLIFVLSICMLPPIFAQQAHWNIYLYMEPGDDLHQAALKNLNDLAKNKPDGVNIFALLHYHGNTAMLYSLEKNILRQMEEVIVDRFASETFVPVVKKLEAEHPAAHHCVVLWNHGYGILLPEYDENSERWSVALDDTELQPCPIRLCRRNSKKRHRGMITNFNTMTCMDNDEMILLFERLAHDVFHKKIDICGLDMCKGAMVEHGYQLKDYVDFLIGSQECELADGWPYDLIMLYLKKDPSIKPRELATKVIEAYNAYYQSHAPVGVYTQSALDLQYIEALKHNLDTVVDLLLEFNKQDDHKELVKHIRKQCRAFCDAPMYVDCYALFEYLILELDSITNNELAKALKTACKDACDIISKMVIANAVGPAIAGDVNGVSIYYPIKNIDRSYLSVPFAQESKWLSFLQSMIDA